jgi:CheY-like chemotaxis protein
VIWPAYDAVTAMAMDPEAQGKQPPRTLRRVASLPSTLLSTATCQGAEVEGDHTNFLTDFAFKRPWVSSASACRDMPWPRPARSPITAASRTSLSQANRDTLSHGAPCQRPAHCRIPIIVCTSDALNEPATRWRSSSNKSAAVPLDLDVTPPASPQSHPLVVAPHGSGGSMLADPCALQARTAAVSGAGVSGVPRVGPRCVPLSTCSSALVAGADECLHKPVGYKELQAALSRHLSDLPHHLGV